MWKVLPLFFLFSSQTESRVVINEAYYDHPGLDTGHEFVELINASSEPVPLEGYEIRFHDGSSTGWANVWTGTPADTIGPGRLFVLGDSLVPARKDALVTLRLQNGPDAIALFRNDVCIDRLGYGALEDSLYYEGRPAEDVDEGRSLARKPDGRDSGDNSRDFQAAVPSPGARNVPEFDVTLSAAPGTPRRAASPTGVEDVRLRVANRGLRAIDSGAVVVTVHDSAAAGWRLLGEAVSDAMEVEGTSDVTVPVGLEPGYHFLRAVAAWPRDERPVDNATRLVRRVGPSDILISEVMSHPAPGCPEYVEVANVGAAPFVLDGAAFRDAVRAPVRIAGGGVLPPSGFIVITEDPGELIRWFSMLQPAAVHAAAGSWPSLNHTGTGAVADSVILLDRLGIPLDGIAYPPQSAASRGTSLERVDLFTGGGHTWVLSSEPGGGSPGRRNPTAMTAPPRDHHVRVSPATFDPDRGERVVITVPAQQYPARALVRIFDTDGTEVRELGMAGRLPFVFVWEGEGDGGRTVTPGVYLVVCEFIDEGGVRRVEKITIGRGRRR